eukprot:TRINITY_DN64236_c0_g1_i4.p1 TRINITY_DN64236_c0_g1~~TRINITY_DN64236_c0_g1_i4.p1  ORF type:complete len:685 (-),score=157.86 TRINITY_DN64236_c0_g1_i4:136-2190(-)
MPPPVSISPDQTKPTNNTQPQYQYEDEEDFSVEAEEPVVDKRRLAEWRSNKQNAALGQNSNPAEKDASGAVVWFEPAVSNGAVRPTQWVEDGVEIWDDTPAGGAAPTVTIQGPSPRAPPGGLYAAPTVYQSSQTTADGRPVVVLGTQNEPQPLSLVPTSTDNYQSQKQAGMQQIPQMEGGYDWKVVREVDDQDPNQVLEDGVEILEEHIHWEAVTGGNPGWQPVGGVPVAASGDTFPTLPSYDDTGAVGFQQNQQAYGEPVVAYDGHDSEEHEELLEDDENYRAAKRARYYPGHSYADLENVPADAKEETLWYVECSQCAVYPCPSSVFTVNGKFVCEECFTKDGVKIVDQKAAASAQKVELNGHNEQVTDAPWQERAKKKVRDWLTYQEDGTDSSSPVFEEEEQQQAQQQHQQEQQTQNQDEQEALVTADSPQAMPAAAFITPSATEEKLANGFEPVTAEQRRRSSSNSQQQQRRDATPPQQSNEPTEENNKNNTELTSNLNTEEADNGHRPTMMESYAYEEPPQQDNTSKLPADEPTVEAEPTTGGEGQPAAAVNRQTTDELTPPPPENDLHLMSPTTASEQQTGYADEPTSAVVESQPEEPAGPSVDDTIKTPPTVAYAAAANTPPTEPQPATTPPSVTMETVEPTPDVAPDEEPHAPTNNDMFVPAHAPPPPVESAEAGE